MDACGELRLGKPSIWIFLRLYIPQLDRQWNVVGLCHGDLLGTGTCELNIVTGAFSFTGRYIAKRLLSLGKGVRTLTRCAGNKSPFGDKVSTAPYNFHNLSRLSESMRGATTLYNTYWVRFPYGRVTFEEAIENTRTLIRAADAAGIRRIVHVSVTNASEESLLPYFRGKAAVEKDVMNSGLSYAIVRPTLIFGPGDILINNIAWFLRWFPVFALFGFGDYRVQPVFVEDVARIAVESGCKKESFVIDAAGPDTYRFEELVRLIADKTGNRAKIIHLRPRFALLLLRLVGYVVGDVVLTDGEMQGLMKNLLVSTNPPTGQTRLSDWLARNADSLGKVYASELKRNYRLRES